MIRDMIFGTVGGLALFLFGMNMMSDGLKKVSGKRLKTILESMTKRRLFGFLIGAGVTALIQSSSAATVMVVGFVNAGMLTLLQASSVIIGTNVGTTATAWLVSLSGFQALKITSYALPAIAVGFAMQFIAKKRMTKDVGLIVLGFGILFVGVSFMKNAFAGFERSEAVHNIFISVADEPVFAVLAGLAVTMIIQSSSAAVASIQLLANGGAFGQNWDVALIVAIPFILGSNIGTTITAQLASLGKNINARRAAWAHTMFNVIGAAVVYWFIDWLGAFIEILCPWELGESTIAVSIAVAHTVVKTIEAVMFLPLTRLLEKVVVTMIKGTPDDLEARPVILEENLLGTPEIALEQAKREIVQMAKTSKAALMHSIESMLGDDRKKIEMVRQTEDFIDMIQLEITSYLTALSQRQISDEASKTLPVLLHTVNDLERIGDHAVNIVEIAERKIDQKLVFSDSAMSEAQELEMEISQMFGYVIAALKVNDLDAAKAAIGIEKKINQMQIDFRRNHVQRMTDGNCSPVKGLIFIDLVDNVEKIGDHLTNIAQAVIGGLQWEGTEMKISPAFQNVSIKAVKKSPAGPLKGAYS